MSTRSTISLQIGKNKIKSIYCHWDGYIENNGLILLLKYNKKRKIKQLLALGSISSLHNRIRIKNKLNHTFENRDKFTTLAYHRDRGEDLEICDKIFEEEYNYLFKNGKWFVSCSLTSNKFERLDSFFKKIKGKLVYKDSDYEDNYF